MVKKFDKKIILVITNDSTVVLKKGISDVFSKFGGRVTEVKNLVARLDTAEKNGTKMCDVSFGMITSHYGFVPGNYMITDYEKVMDCKEDYLKVQEEKDYLTVLNHVTTPFDKVIVCVPKDMFAMFLEENIFIRDNIIAVTSLDFKEECEKRGWTFLERKGARVGNENADEIFRLIEEIC